MHQCTAGISTSRIDTSKHCEIGTATEQNLRCETAMGSAQGPCGPNVDA